MKRVTVIFTAALVGVLVGRLQHDGRSSASGATGSVTPTARSGATRGGDARDTAAALAPLLQRLASIPSGRGPTEHEARILAAVREPDDAIELRHETQLGDLRQRGISLGHDALDHYLRVTDAMVQRGRLDRARFVLGELTEQEYLDARIATTNGAFAAYQQGISKDDFRRLFQWLPDKGPFDAEGSLAKPWSQGAAEASSTGATNKDPSVPPVGG